jgi:hypothetical protein
LQYIEQNYFPSHAYMTQQGRPVVTNFNIDLSYTVDWAAVTAALSTQPVFLFQNNDGFTHVLSDGSYSWVMPTTSDYGMSYLTSFYDSGMAFTSELTIGAAYKGFNDSLAAWGSGRVMGQQCGQTWLQTFSEINGLYNSGKQLPALQLVTWNDYEEGTEIESGISNCLTVSATVSGSSLQWTVKGDEATVDHYVAYISTDGQNLMALGDINAGSDSVNLCSYSIPNGSYTLFVQAVGKPSMTNQMSGSVKFTSNCAASTTVSFGTNPSSMTIAVGGSGNVTVTAAAQSGAFNNAIALSCSGLPKGMTCSFSPASITPGAGTVNSVLIVSAATLVSANRRDGSRALLATWMFGFGWFGLMVGGRIQRRRIVTVFGACVLAALIVGGTSCGGNTASNTVPNASNAASYTVTVNGSSSAVQLSTTVTVTVK